MRQWGFYLGLRFSPPRHYVHGSPPSSSLSNDAEALLSAYSFAYNIIINWYQELNAALRKNVTYDFRLRFAWVSHLEAAGLMMRIRLKRS